MVKRVTTGGKIGRPKRSDGRDSTLFSRVRPQTKKVVKALAKETDLLPSQVVDFLFHASPRVLKSLVNQQKAK